MIGKKIKEITCTNCQKIFKNIDAQKVCSNCFACTGCEAYVCPFCALEIVIVPFKKYKINN
jgi:hypothetical protein